ncbi:MAG: fumarate hydratase [Methanomicrobiales archaeon]|nr:fumarate hydratase [Methanomicrobiales archaeon]
MQNTPNTPLFEAVADATCRALQEAEVHLPADVLRALQRAEEREPNPVARSELRNILRNVELAEELRLPLCQDTGVPVLYVSLPPDVPLSERLYAALAEGVRRATERVPLRPNVVDPLTRENRGDNTGPGMPSVHLRPGERFAITALPKGAGSENVSRIGMLLPSEREGIERFVVETVLRAGGRPCPPLVLGVGIGGTFDGSAALAKEALLSPIDTMTGLERRLCEAVNALGIGPMGLGGETTALAVKVRQADCHTASLPVAVNVQCWACRRATVEVRR